MSTPLACGDRSGFLFAHACDRPATGACAVCGRPICIEHTRMGSAGPTCISCLRGESAGDRDRSTGSDSTTSGDRAGVAPEDSGAPPEGHFGGAGASASWPAQEGERAELAKSDDPYFFGGGPDRASYYDADDYRAFDVVTAASAAEAAGDAGEADGAPDTDTGAS